MKKRILIFLLLLALVLGGCGTGKVYTVEEQGMVFTVDTENRTITQADTVYTYEIRGDRYTVTYPDGATFSMSWSGNIGTGGGSGSYYDSPRLDGDILTDILKEHQARRKDPAQILLCLLVAGLGVFQTAVPRAAWYLRRGWLYKDAEPSDAALAVARISGIVLMILGVIFMFI